MTNKTLLAYRNFSGVGDWIMGLTVLKMVNQQYPDMEIYLNLTAKNAHKKQKKYKGISPFIREIIKNFDVKLAGVTFFENVKTHLNEFDYVSNLKYHKRDGLNFIQSMVNTFNALTGLKLKYDSSVYAQYQGGNKRTIKDPYVLIQACSKRNNYHQTWKDYGVNNMQQVVNYLSDNKLTIYQIGGKDGPTLTGVIDHFKELTLNELYSVMSNCDALIGLDGMLGCFAAHHAVKQYIIYSGKFNMAWTDFPHRVQLNGNSMSPKQISDVILKGIPVYA
jgi:ADP-heptose:LPS heptosyltransferase